MFELPIFIISIICLIVIISLVIYYFLERYNSTKAINTNIGKLIQDINYTNFDIITNDFNIIQDTTVANTSNLSHIKNSLSNINNNYNNSDSWLNTHFQTNVTMINQDDYLLLNKNLQTSNIVADKGNINELSLNSLCMGGTCIDGEDISRRNKEILTNNSSTNDDEHKVGLTGRHGLQGPSGPRGPRGKQGLAGQPGTPGETGQRGFNLSNISHSTDILGNDFLNFTLTNNINTNQNRVLKESVSNLVGINVRDITITSQETMNALNIQYTNGTYKVIPILESSNEITQTLSNQTVSFHGMQAPVGYNHVFTIGSNAVVENGLNVYSSAGLGVGVSNIIDSGTIYAKNSMNIGNYSIYNSNLNTISVSNVTAFNNGLNTRGNIVFTQGGKTFTPGTDEYLRLNSGLNVGDITITGNKTVNNVATLNGIVNINGHSINTTNDINLGEISWTNNSATNSIANQHIGSTGNTYINSKSLNISGCNMDINFTRLSGNTTGFSSILGNSEIANDSQLNIYGTNVGTGQRQVGIYDKLNVNANVSVSNMILSGGGQLNPGTNLFNANNIFVRSNIIVGQTGAQATLDSSGTLTCPQITIGTYNFPDGPTFSNFINRAHSSIYAPKPGLQGPHGLMNCSVSDWSDAGICSKPCGGGLMQQNRSVIYNASPGGQGCPSLTQDIEPCNTGLCCKNISGNYSRTDGVNTVITMTSDDACTGTITYNNATYPINAAAAGANVGSNWHWGNTTATLQSDNTLILGDGRNTRLLPENQNITTLPAGSYIDSCINCTYIGNTLQCQCYNQNQVLQPLSALNMSTCAATTTYPNSKGAAQSAASNVNGNLQCVMDCAMTDWSGCDTGSGTQTRTVKTQATNGGAGCPTSTQNCAVDCQLTGWSGYGGCSVNCGGGTQTRTRTVTQQALNGGNDCKNYSLSDSQSCNTQGCGPPQQWVYGNNGSVSCDTYCRGTGGNPWNWELPQWWNGAQSVGQNGNHCLCQQTGWGWHSDPPPGATFYIDCNYSGFSITLQPGWYNMYDLINRGMPNDNISSIQTNGHYVAIYWDANFSGASMGINGNISCLVDYGWNDQISSIIVY